MTVVLALLGAKSLYILFVWLGSAALAGWLATYKGFPERYGLASGLVLLVLGPAAWLYVPFKKFEVAGASVGSDISVLAPERTRGGFVLATRWVRLLAQVADGLLFAVPFAVFAVLLGDGPALVIIAALIVVASRVYAPLTMARGGDRNGMTIGKQVMGLRVVRDDGQPMTVADGFGREFLFRSLPSGLTLGIYGVVDAVWSFFNPGRKTLHDRFGKTTVVDAR
ncbi:RDD family protein [Patulibacter sp. NPDC049589]|uniref:RDD family protein n=1 Tax=Patulibacter sp. NPDC049589 TaxID=3154731 RepID=UPI00341E45E5